MSSLFFWIIVLTFLVPTARRLYRKSVNGRDGRQGVPGGFPDQPGNQYPGQYPGQLPPPQNNQPRDGYTQQDYFGGGFRQPGEQPTWQQPKPPIWQQPNQPTWQQQGTQPSAQQRAQPAGPEVPPAPAPQGFRARKLAELDQRYSNGELAMEDYMAQRAQIMNG